MIKVRFFCWQPGEFNAEFGDRINKFISDKDVKWVLQSESGDGKENWSITVSVWYEEKEVSK